MGGPARLVVVLALAAAAQVAAATDRFVPADPQFHRRRRRGSRRPMTAARPDRALARAPGGHAASVALARAFLERAQRLREPMYIGRAEAVLRRWSRAHRERMRSAPAVRRDPAIPA